MIIEIHGPEVDEIEAGPDGPFLQGRKLFGRNLGQRRDERHQFDVHYGFARLFFQNRLGLEDGHFQEWRRFLTVLLHDFPGDGNEFDPDTMLCFQELHVRRRSISNSQARQAISFAPASFAALATSATS